MKDSAGEKREGSQESEQFRSVVDNLATIAEAVAADPEDTFQLTMEKVEIPGLGVLHWQQFLEELHVRVTERPEKHDVHGKEIDCLYVHTDDGWEFAHSSEAFKITTARPQGGRHGFYKIVERGDGFVQVGEHGAQLTPEDIAAVSDLAQSFAQEALRFLKP